MAEIKAEIKVEHELTLSREEVADWLVDLADAIREGATAELPLSGPVLTVPVADDIDVDIEVEIDGDEVELELELSWSLARPEKPSSAQDDGAAASETAPETTSETAPEKASERASEKASATAAAPAAAKSAAPKKPKTPAGATGG
jgi:amphi-Trp domain-containing protein